MTMRLGIAPVTASALLLGCAHVGALKEKAGRDLGCPADQVEVLNDGKTRDVEACGKRATYHWTGAHWMRQETKPAEDKASPPPPPRKEEWQ